MLVRSGWINNAPALPWLQLMIFDSRTDMSRSKQFANAIWPGSGELRAWVDTLASRLACQPIGG